MWRPLLSPGTDTPGSESRMRSHVKKKSYRYNKVGLVSFVRFYGRVLVAYSRVQNTIDIAIEAPRWTTPWCPRELWTLGFTIITWFRLEPVRVWFYWPVRPLINATAARAIHFMTLVTLQLYRFSFRALLPSSLILLVLWVTQPESTSCTRFREAPEERENFARDRRSTREP